MLSWDLNLDEDLDKGMGWVGEKKSTGRSGPYG